MGTKLDAKLESYTAFPKMGKPRSLTESSF
jgi:hypothetical protein